MIRKTMFVLVAFMLVVVFAGCARHTHRIGDGGTGERVSEQRQLYLGWGLIPILEEADSTEMVDNATNYTIVTEYTPVDFLINWVGGYITLHSRTVRVEE